MRIKRYILASLCGCCLIFSSTSLSQSPNDDCLTAKDISLVFDDLSNGDYHDCPFANGVFGSGLAVFEFDFDEAQVGVPNYISDECTGISDQTSPWLPDIWYKAALYGNYGNTIRGFEIFAWDTLQIATYLGTCEELYQIRCMTPSPGNMFSGELTIPEISGEDTLFIQLRSNTLSPPDIFCFNNIFGVTYYHATHPAIVWETTGTGVASRVNEFLELIPNPASQFTTFHISTKIQSIAIIDQFGRPVNYDNNGSGTINIDKLLPGTYTVRVIDKSADVFIGKLVKSN